MMAKPAGGIHNAQTRRITLIGGACFFAGRPALIFTLPLHETDCVTTLRLSSNECARLGDLAWRLAVLGFFVFMAPTASAWNAAGHRLVAAIAWDQLDAHTRSRVAGLLRQHPDADHWLKRAGTGDADRTAFIESSTWPDEIRNDPRFYNAGIDDETPLLSGFADMDRHRDWHYVNRPPDAAPGGNAVSGQLDKQLVLLASTVGARHVKLSRQAYALPWLIHLTADAHQPLHAADRRNKQGDGEMVINPFNVRRPSSTLHAFWDDLPGPPWLRGARLDAACVALTAAYPHPAPALPNQWLEESFQIARNAAYPPGPDPVPTISAAFMAQAREIANQRVAVAGFRLADLLRERLR